MPPSLGMTSAKAGQQALLLAIDAGAWRGPEFFFNHKAMLAACRAFLANFDYTTEQETRFIQPIEEHWFCEQIRSQHTIKQSEQLVQMLTGDLEVIARLDKSICDRFAQAIAEQNDKIKRRTATSLFKEAS